MILNIEEVNKSLWDEFHAISPQGSVFSSSLYLENYDTITKYFLIKKGRETIGGIPVLTKNNSIGQVPFLIDNGLHYASFENHSEYSKNEMRHKINTLVANEFFQRFQSLSFINHWSVIDLRAFLWTNHGNIPKFGGYKITPYYTTIINSNSTELKNSFSQARRWEIKKFQNAGAINEESSDLSNLYYLHDLTFKRQGLQKTSDETALMKKITTVMLASNQASLYYCKFKNQIVSATFWLRKNKKAYYLFGANHPEFRNYGGNALSLFNSMQDLSSKFLIEQFDLCGINSPNRGSFKVSFGGNIIPYLKVEKIHAVIV